MYQSRMFLAFRELMLGRQVLNKKTHISALVSVKGHLISGDRNSNPK